VIFHNKFRERERERELTEIHISDMNHEQQLIKKLSGREIELELVPWSAVIVGFATKPTREEPKRRKPS